jgi:glutaredoxin
MIKIYVLEGCPYCNNALRLLEQYRIRHKIIVVEHHEKEYYKKKNKMNTFPQIFLEKDKNKLIKIGGNDDFERILSVCQMMHQNNISIDVLSFFFKKVFKK